MTNKSIKVVHPHLEPTKPEDHPAEVNTVNGKFPHLTAPGGWDAEKKAPIAVLTFDPDCPTCQKIAEENRKNAQSR